MHSDVHEHENLDLDSALAERILGWENSYTASETVSITANWYAHFIKGHDARELMRENLMSYWKMNDYM